MLRQAFGFDWSKRGFFRSYEPRIEQVTVSEDVLQPYLARLIYGVVPGQPGPAA
jgi:hypothetical protein